MWIGGGIMAWNPYQQTKRVAWLVWALLAMVLLYNPEFRCT